MCLIPQVVNNWFCYLWISKTRARAPGARPQPGSSQSVLLGSVAAAWFFGGAAERTARRSLAGRELGAAPGRRGRGRSAPRRLRQLRAGIAAERRTGECGGTRGRAGRERASERASERGREGARESARLGTGRRRLPLPRPHPGGCTPLAPLLHPSARGLDTLVAACRPPPPNLSPAGPRLRAAPASAATPPAPRHARAIVSAVGSRGPALPSERGPWSPQSQPRRVRSPRFSHARGSPHLASGGPFFTEFWLFFPGGRRLPPVGSGGQSFRPPSRASPPARSEWPPRN